MRENYIGIWIYKDTVTQEYEGDNNLCIINIPIDFVREYASKNQDYNSYEEWLKNYTCDETDNLFGEVIENSIDYYITDIN